MTATSRQQRRASFSPRRLSTEAVTSRRQQQLRDAEAKPTPRHRVHTLTGTPTSMALALLDYGLDVDHQGVDCGECADLRRYVISWLKAHRKEMIG